jgi:hypothetical protein
MLYNNAVSNEELIRIKRVGKVIISEQGTKRVVSGTFCTTLAFAWTVWQNF